MDAKNYSGSGSQWNDSSGNNQFGTLVNSPTYTSGSAPFFSFNNNSQQYVSFSAATSIPTGKFNYTLLAWVSFASNRQNGIIGWGTYNSNNQVNAFRNRTQGGLLNYWWANDLAGNTTLNTNTWYQVVATYQTGTTTGTRRIYVNNSLISTDNPTSSLQNTTPNTNFTVAATWLADNEYLNGALSVAKVYNRALSAGEISADFTAFRARFPA
jgi:hypothetical protein